jgi:hypothetical protein
MTEAELQTFLAPKQDGQSNFPLQQDAQSNLTTRNLTHFTSGYISRLNRLLITPAIIFRNPFKYLEEKKII